MVSIDQNKCIGCGMCVKDCFFGVLSVKDGKAQVSGDCFNCGHCIAVCPANAVTIPEYPMEEVREYDESCKMNPENLLHFMQFRRSVRQFKKEPVPMEYMQNILEAGRYSPTAANLQDVSYILVKENLEEFKKIVWDGLGERLAKGIPDPYAYRMQLFYDAYRENPEKDMLFCGADVCMLVLSNAPVNGNLAMTSMELMAQAQGVGVLYSGFLQRIILDTPKALEFLGLDGTKTLGTVMLYGMPAVKYHRTAPRKKINVTWK
ncbi:nitroreductase family protein [Anaerotignum sp.]